MSQKDAKSQRKTYQKIVRKNEKSYETVWKTLKQKKNINNLKEKHMKNLKEKIYQKP